MHRLTKYEMLVLVAAVLLALTATIGYLADVAMIFDLALVVLLILILVAINLVVVRIDRAVAGQKRAREEIYQVLYSLHGNYKWTETQARKTRDLIRDNHQALVSEVRQLVSRVELTTRDKAREVPGTLRLHEDNAMPPEYRGRVATLEKDLERITRMLDNIQNTQEGILPQMSEHYSVRAKQLVSILDAQRQELAAFRIKAEEFIDARQT